MRGFLRVLLFVVIGPLVGLLVLALLVGCYTLITTGSTRDFAFGPELVSPGILIATYAVGGIPALLTGIAAIFVARWKSGWAGWLITLLVGASITLVGVVVVLGGPGLEDVRRDPEVVTVLTLSGAAAGFVCAMLFDGLASLARRRAA